jgi:tetratricopeptide (TPR) repeat protein
LFGQSEQTELAKLADRADEAYTKQNWQVAREEYAKVVSLDPNNAAAFARLGIADQKLGKLNDAEASFERVLKIDPSFPGVGVLLAFVYLGREKFREAIPLLEKDLDNSGNDLPLRLLAGERLVDVYFLIGDEEKGLEVAQKLRKLAPDNPDVLYTAASVYSTLWKNVVNRMYASNANSFRAHQLLAEAAEAKGDFSQAAKEYRLVIKMEPRLPGIRYRLGLMILRTNPTSEGTQEALAEFNKGLEIDPRDVPTHIEIGEIYLKAQRLEDAASHFSRAIELQPSYVRAHVGLGKVLLEQKKYQAAAAQFEQAVRLAPNDQTTYYGLMLAYRALGRDQDAKVAMESFQKLRKQQEQDDASTLKQLQAPLSETSHPNP